MADVTSLSDKVIIISSIITAITTVVIAVYAIFSHRLAKRIERQSNESQNKFHELLLALTSATLVAGKTVGESELATELFKEQKDKLKQEMNKTNKS